jgi:MFS family permease
MHAPANKDQETSAFAPDSRQAWRRLVLALLIGSIGSVGLWSVVVVLPFVQAEFSASRGAASLAYTMMMSGFGVGGIVVGRITDRFGIVRAIAITIVLLGLAYCLAGASASLWQFVVAHLLIGLGASAMFAPLMAEVSHWFERYRGLAVTKRAATTSRARCGRRWSVGAVKASAGAPPI